MAHDLIQSRFRNAVTAALSKFEETAKLDHAGLKGRIREIFVKDLLRPILSADFVAGSGLVVDSIGGTSREADVVIFDRFHVPAVLYKEDEGYFPIEGVCYYGEIKSKLTKPELRDALEKFRTFTALNPLLNAKGQKLWPPRFLFAWSSDLTGNDIESELDRYIDVDDAALTAPACSIFCIVGKGYCCVINEAGGSNGWYKIGKSDGLQEVVNFIGGVANSLVDFRMSRFGTKFGNYIIPYAQSVRLRDAGS
jgi:hypothetical protein